MQEPLNIVLLIAMGLAPGIAIAMYVYFKDKFEKEPLSLLIISFFLGALAGVPTLLSSMALAQIHFFEDNLFLRTYLGVGLLEEFWKFITIILFTYPKRSFNEPYDGITYAVMVSMGFASLENVLYVLNNGWEVAVLRSFTAVPAHATFGVMMGYFLGLAKFKRIAIFHMMLALLIPAIFHGTYDYFLFQKYDPGLVAGAFVSLAVGIYLSLRAIRLHRINSPFNDESNS